MQNNEQLNTLMDIFPIEKILWIVFLCVLFVFVIYSIIVVYHWFRYAFSTLGIYPLFFVYFGVSFFLISTMLVALISM